MAKVPRRKKKTKAKAKRSAARKKTTKTQASKGGSGGPTGRPKGKTSGLGIQDAWAHIFQKNEKASKNKRLTDEQISKWMHKEFPGRGSTVFDHVQGVRTKYNKGGLSGNVAPKTQSKRYDSDGAVIPPRVGRPETSKKTTKKKKTTRKTAAKKKTGRKKAAKKRSRRGKRG